MTPAAGSLRRLAVVLAAGISLAGCGLQRDLADIPNVGGSGITDAPPLSGPTLQRGTFDLAAHRGHIVVLDFWASWCGPCHKQQPDLDKLAAEFMPRGMVFVGVDMLDDDASGRAYIAEYGVPYPSLADTDGEIANRFSVPAPPMTMVIDGGGHIIKRILGGITVADLEPLLLQLTGTH